MTREELVEYHPTIKELPVSERPRERLEHYGARALSTAELLAIILYTELPGIIHLSAQEIRTKGIHCRNVLALC